MTTICKIHLNTSKKSTLNGKEIPYEFSFYMIHASIEVPILKKRTNLAFHIEDDAITPTEITFEAKPYKSKRLKIPLISNASYSEYKNLQIHLEKIFNRPIVDYTIVNLPNTIVTAINKFHETHNTLRIERHNVQLIPSHNVNGFDGLGTITAKTQTNTKQIHQVEIKSHQWITIAKRLKTPTKLIIPHNDDARDNTILLVCNYFPFEQILISAEITSGSKPC